MKDGAIMNNKTVYKDIAKRTDSNIYLGIVGPVRVGKSTFIKKFMENMVIPHIENQTVKDRAIDELPQSASGKTIMTTEPKFVPEEAVKIKLEDNISLNVRMIDCVGYIVPAAIGYIENNEPRMVMTPWFEKEIPFNMAAEIGTKKVITEHSTIGIVITTDGSITDIPREEYVEAEERVIGELKAIDKPFVILLNCKEPNSRENRELRESMVKKYDVPVIAINCLELNEEIISDILKAVLYQFPVKQVAINVPTWLMNLPKEHKLKRSVYDTIKATAPKISSINNIDDVIKELTECEYIDYAKASNIDLGSGQVSCRIDMSDGIFYKILSDETGLNLNSEEDLMPCMLELTEIKKQYDKIRGAIDEVNATGYGIVMPSLYELTLEKPEIVKQGGRYGVKLKASAPSIHMMKADITTEVSPIVGSEKQSEELVHYLLQEFEDTPEKIWESNIFGKSLHELVNEGLHNKLYRMPQDARIKIQETIERIINEGCSGLICIIL